MRSGDFIYLICNLLGEHSYSYYYYSYINLSSKVVDNPYGIVTYNTFSNIRLSELKVLEALRQLKLSYIPGPNYLPVVLKFLPSPSCAYLTHTQYFPNI